MILRSVQPASNDRKQKNQSEITPSVKAFILKVKTKKSTVCDVNH